MTIKKRSMPHANFSVSDDPNSQSLIPNSLSFSPSPSSYRDPSGFIFLKDDVVYRQVNKKFKEHFEHFVTSGCYQHLVNKGLLVRHEIIDENITSTADWYQTLKPENIPFISYPYEWSFDMLRDAALLTLRLLRESLPFKVMLKDATPFNVQWLNGKLIFIDTLSFEKYEEGQPWIAYRQFCEAFLSPLLLMHYSKNSLQELLLAYPNGIPLAITHSLLPWKSHLSFYTSLHIHLHSRMAARTTDQKQKQVYFSEKKLLNLVESLESLIRSLKWNNRKSTWSHYYNEAAERDDYLEQKQNIIQKWLTALPVTSALDIGANNGKFSMLLAERKIKTIAVDFDPYAINDLYAQIKTSGEKNILPLIIDLSNPTPAIGLNNIERYSFLQRANTDLVLALALVHHLAIGKNIPFDFIADLFAGTGNNLIVEFIPKQDEKIKLMLSHKKDIYDDYNEESFKRAFERHFSVVEKQTIPGTDRTLFLMKKHQGQS